MKTKTLTQIVLLFSLVAIMIAACTPYQEPTPALPTVELPTGELPDKFDKLTPIAPIEKDPIDMTPISLDDLPAELRQVAEEAMTALEEELSIQKSQIEVISIQSVVWSDSSLGCPQPDMNYLMVLTEGYRVVLAVDGEPYYYHANKNGYGIICESPNPPYSEGAVDR